MDMMSNDLSEEIPSNQQVKSSNVRERFKAVADKNKPESTSESSLRIGGQLASRAGELFVGQPGNIKKAFQQTTDYLKSFLPDSLNFNESGKQALGSPEKGSWEDTLFNPPTSDELRNTATKNIAEKLTGDKERFEPRGKKEEFAGNLAQDVSSMFMPGTGQMRLMTRLGAPILGNLAKEGLKYVGVDEKNADKAKLGVMLATAISGQTNPGQFAGERIGQAKSMVPDSTTVFAGPMAQNLQPLITRMQRGFRNVPSKTRAIQGLNDLAGQVDPQGRINLRSLMDARDHINEWIAEAGGWEVPGAVRDPTLRNLNELKSQMITTIDQNLSQRFPQAADLYRTGYEAAAVTKRSNAISNYIEKTFGKKATSVGAKLLFPAIGTGAALMPKALVGIAGLYPMYKTGQVLYRVAQSPTLGRYYSDVIQAASMQNAPAMIHSLSKLDKALEKEEKQKLKKQGPTLESFKSRFKNNI